MVLGSSEMITGSSRLVEHLEFSLLKDPTAFGTPKDRQPARLPFIFEYKNP